ncbi:MAG: cupin domain-containing protein [Caulobacter sp.]|nr:cupin domain-containing protein [Caulobacter sp.]
MPGRLLLPALACLLIAPIAEARQPAGPAATVRLSPRALSLGVGDFTPLTPEGSAAMAQLLLNEHPSYRTPLHVHHRTDESFHVLEGRLTLFVDGAVRVLGPGDYAFIPRGTPHAQGNQTDKDAIALVTLAPGDFARFFHARAELVKTTPPDHPDYGPRMRALGQDHDIKIVGPPPF